MTGEDLLNYVRSRIADHGLDNYIQGQRALRMYCTHTGFTWLKEVQGAAIQFLPGVDEYPLGEIGLRRIDAVWVQDPTSTEWLLMTEATNQTFEKHRNDSLEDGTTPDPSDPNATLLRAGNVTQDPPVFYTFQGPSLQTIRVTPTPSATLQGRVDGIANTPQIERTKELPGPAEYHELIGDLWAGLELDHQSLLKLMKPGIQQDELLAARDLSSRGQREVAAATARMERVVRDTFPNRTGTLKWRKVALMR